MLTTVVSLDPMYAYFDMDEPTLLKVRKAINEGRIKRPSPARCCPVFMGLQGEEGFPHEGTINFVDNQVDPTTGSILVRGVFPNPKPETGVRLLSPGMFVRIRLPIGTPHKALLVIDRALGSDQGLKYVYVVDDKDEVQYRRVDDRRPPGGRAPGHLVGPEAGRPGRRRRVAAGPAEMKVQTEKVAHAVARLARSAGLEGRGASRGPDEGPGSAVRGVGEDPRLSGGRP